MNFVMSCIVLATLAAGGALYYGKVQFEGEGPSSTTQTVLIRPNTGTTQIAATLEREGLIAIYPQSRTLVTRAPRSQH